MFKLKKYFIGHSVANSKNTSTAGADKKRVFALKSKDTRLIFLHLFKLQQLASRSGDWMEFWNFLTAGRGSSAGVAGQSELPTLKFGDKRPFWTQSLSI